MNSAGNDTSETKPVVTAWDLLLACLSILVLASLTANLIWDLPEEIHDVLHTLDTTLCLVFLADFIRRFVTAKSKMAYMKWGWIDLLASIPSLDALRWGRIVSLTRIFIILRVLRSGRILFRVLRHDPSRAVIALTLLATLMIMILGSILILHVEVAEKSNIKTAHDALWWSLTTVTTVGYGDHFPVTVKGRTVGAFMMSTGILLYATFTAFISTKIMELQQSLQTNEADKTQEEMKRIREELQELRKALLDRESDGRK